ncbi:MAG: TonB-dependent receptor [Gemmatimonadales bacterium]|nr:TonB-dependent receptor [Gemmatimonadales bacterium]MYG48032.1 TonB-dependent receptor [Gemmatimonadales bacterium]MYK01561.1 TonB-dependent receptor [Candidatus Palauibacter ramosifaciens]
MSARGARLALCVAIGLAGILRPGAARAQLEGRVYDLESGAGIPAAEVAWIPAPAAGAVPDSAARRGSVRTDASGSFIPGPRWGSGGAITVSASGYRSRTIVRADAAAEGWRIGLARDPLALDEIVVTASSLPRLRSQVAVPMETVEAEEIDAAGVASADRLLAELPGVQVAAATPVGSNLMIRGVGGARVLVLLDGQPTAGALLENRDLSRMSLTGVERVEIVKGPLSSLYGSDALGGVVNVITQLPASGFRVDARALSGGAGRREAEATASGGGRLRYRITGGWRQEDRIPGLADGGPSAFARVWDFRSRFQFKASDAWDLLATATYLRERQRWPVGGAFSGFNDNAGFSGSVEARRPLGAGTWSGSLFLQEYEHLFRSARGDAPIADGGDDTQWERLAKGAAGYSAVLGGHSVDVGLEVASRAIRSPDKLVEDRAADRQLALFAQDAWRLGGTVLSGGARLTWNDRWGSNVSPTVGVTRRAGAHVHLRAAVARGFRAPSFKELAWNFVNVGGGYVLQGFPDLDPERSWNVSGGVEWQPASTVRIEVEAFTNRIRNLIEPGFVGNTESGLLIFSPRNVADAITRGFEFSLRAVLDRVEFAAGYAYLDAYAVDSGLPLDRRAAHSARARAGWTAEALAGFRLDATAHLTGAAPIIGTGPDGNDARIGTQERFVAVDLQTSVDLGRSLRLVAGVDNLFDVRPAGWQGAIERKLRLGLAVEDLFAR